MRARLWNIQCSQEAINDYYGNGTALFQQRGHSQQRCPGTAPPFNLTFNGLGGNFLPAPNATIVGHMAGTISGTLNWSGGYILGPSLTVASNGVLNIVGSISLYDGLINEGTVNWQSGTVTVFNYSRNGTARRDLERSRRALWNIQCDQSMNDYYEAGTAFFNNEGAVVKNAGPNTATIGVSFANAGTVNVESGTLQFGAEDGLGGTIQTATNAAVAGNLTGTFFGAVNWSGGEEVSGQAAEVASNAVMNIEGNVSLYNALTNDGTASRWQAGTHNNI